MKPIEGVIPILQTPFLEDGSLDLRSLASEVDFAVAAGCTGMAFLGFVSEWWKLNDAETIACARTIVEAVNGRAMVILNVTGQSTHVAVEQARAFESLGADALMCLPPFVVPRSGPAVIEHLEAVLQAVKLPQILQLSPSLTGTQLDPAAVAKLCERYQQLSSIKVDFVPPGPTITKLRNTLPSHVTYLIGFAGVQMFDAVARGAHGLMGGTGHVAEDLAVWSRLRTREGADAFAALLPLLSSEMQTLDQSIATHKWLLKEQGVIASAHVRLPGPSLDEWQIQELRGNRERARKALGL
jgi:4-hydroxy-tetrahydrodipicolinate synthase